MATPQSTPIAIAQNTTHSQRLLAAQSRLYTDAKHIHDIRVLTVLALGVATVVVALSFQNIRLTVGAIGGAVAFLWSVVASGREKRRRREASYVQEEFDTHVFNLPWNEFAADRPSPTVVAEAAARYRGKRTKDWYPDTRNVVRPLDVLICQRSNLGWGSSMHRFYAACLTGAMVLLVLVGVAVMLIADLSTAEALTAVLVPFLGPGRELVEMITSNRESADTKAKTEAKVLALWDRGMRDRSAVTIENCRSVQDLILSSRQSNAHIPDWLDNLRRTRNETLMQESAEHLIEDAIRHGRTP
ncbi:S-4TM family putative pore-forming effector [Embleya scabrispora]|uniref:S-4TM family putative pore-forming effector n=1 Tax=Embleya scabrispora TaxID=159449 RepID=UPI0011810729|nr:S-4TM family putative pore-forming effector [Embleya scabrispora]